MTDIQIAQQAVPLPIGDIAASCGIDPQYVEQYGRCKAKIDYRLLREQAHRPDGKLILVTAITPTPAGEGKTTTTVGLTDGLRKIGKNAVAALREPSLGPVFGVKGGAAGGGYAQVIPMEDINLHFTGDFHAIGAANNLLAALLDNHIQQGNALGIDVKQIVWKRCVDMNDRQLRHVIDGLGGKMQGVPREDGFDITVASEVMAVLCLASDITDLKARLGRMIVAYTFDGRPVTAHDLKAEGAMAALLKDALKPNLVQTLEHSPAFIHGGPFASRETNLLRQVEEGGFVPDDFSHEHSLVLEGSRGLVLFNSCSHGGIVNIVRGVKEQLGRPVYAVFGGLHLFSAKAASGMNCTPEYALSVADALVSEGVERIYTGHCTGTYAYDRLQAILGQRLRPLTGGMTADIGEGVEDSASNEL